MAFCSDKHEGLPTRRKRVSLEESFQLIGEMDINETVHFGDETDPVQIFFNASGSGRRHDRPAFLFASFWNCPLAPLPL